MAKIKIATLTAFAETAFLTGLLVWQVFRVWPSLAHHPSNLALLVVDALPVLLVLVRRPAEALSQSPFDWLVAYVGAAAPILLGPGGEAVAPASLCSVLMIAGLLINLYGKICLNRSFGIVAANRGVQRLGPYRLVRHPIYAGNALTQIGFLLGNLTLANLALCVAGLTLQVIRLQAEEKLLGQDPAYAEYMAQVPYRLAPGLY